MRLYSGSTENFVEDATRWAIAEKLRSAFFDYFRYYPSEHEVNAWDNSLGALAENVKGARLFDQGIMIEYQLPLTSLRIDAIFAGRNLEGMASSVIVELKQWQRYEEPESDNEVLTWVGGAEREVLHPSIQARNYRDYVLDTHTAFQAETDPLTLDVCSYLHNYRYAATDPIFSDKFKTVVDEVPIFTFDRQADLEAYLRQRLGSGDGLTVLDRIERGSYKPSKKLLEHVAKVIKCQPAYILLDEQQVVFDKMLSTVRKGIDDEKKRVLLVKGGPVRSACGGCGSCLVSG
jgi:hypothetical protein